MSLDVAEDQLVKPEDARQARRRRWPWVAAMVVAALVTVPVVLFLTHWPFTREKITADIQQQFPGSVTIQKFHRIIFRTRVAWPRALRCAALQLVRKGPR